MIDRLLAGRTELISDGLSDETSRIRLESLRGWADLPSLHHGRPTKLLAH